MTWIYFKYIFWYRGVFFYITKMLFCLPHCCRKPKNIEHIDCHKYNFKNVFSQQSLCIFYNFSYWACLTNIQFCSYLDELHIWMIMCGLKMIWRIWNLDLKFLERGISLGWKMWQTFLEIKFLYSEWESSTCT